MDTYYGETVHIYEEYDDPRCSACAKPVDDGSVFQFGQGIWHFECFNCARCKKWLNEDSNLLLLRDNSPICEECLYNCNACHTSIQDEAIMTDNEAYHADCFRCAQCNTRIEDLVFTQTSKGIFCMSCHEMRKRMRQKRKEERLLQQQHYMQSDTPIHATDNDKSSDPRLVPTAGLTPDPKKSILTSNELAELNRMLSSTVESGIADDQRPAQLPSSQPKMHVATSLSTDTAVLADSEEQDQTDQPKATVIQDSINRTDAGRESDLEAELQSTQLRLKQVEAKFNKIKMISHKALDEFQIVKEGYHAEITARQSAEAEVKKLEEELAVYHQASMFGVEESLTWIKQEVATLHATQLDLENVCRDLCEQRDTLAAAAKGYESKILSHAPGEMRLEHNYQAWKQQLRSIQMDIDNTKSSYSKLSKARDVIINKMITLNTKNAELTSMNNSLSRRAKERERDALLALTESGVLGRETEKTQPVTHKPTSRDSLELETDPTPAVLPERTSLDQDHEHRVAHRNSISHVDPPKKFKFRRKKGGVVFGRRNNHHKKDDDKIAVVPNDAHHGQPLNPLVEPASRATNPDGTGQQQEQAEQTTRPSRPHNLLQTKLLRAKCEVCGDKIRRANELKCLECRFVCHFKCMLSAGNTCGDKTYTNHNDKDTAHRVPIFGNSLIDQVHSEHGPTPLVVQTCVEAVEARGMNLEGIYRKSGTTGQMKLLQQAFEKGDAVDLTDQDQWDDICAVTSVLKQYFRELPNPLFTFELHSRFIEAEVSSEPVMTFRQLIHSLPAEHFQTLKYLMQHLNRVQQRHEENFMTARNLAVVFGPTLMRHQDDNQDFMDMNRKIGVIEFIINHTTDLFVDPAPTSRNISSPLPTTSNSAPRRPQHRREMSTGAALHAASPTPFPREKPGYI